MEYVIGVCFGVAVLIGLYFFRRRSRRQEERVDFRCVTRKAADGSDMIFLLHPRPSST
jgi:hypothetical protein